MRRFKQMNPSPISLNIHTILGFVIGLAMGVISYFIIYPVPRHLRFLDPQMQMYKKPTVNYDPGPDQAIIVHDLLGHPFPQKDMNVKPHVGLHGFENHEIADELFKKVRILCWIATYPKNHPKKAIHVKNTWGKRCNKLIFMSTKKDNELGAVKLPVIENYSYLWGKTKEAFKYIYRHHFKEYDWFLKADDDTYVVVENLRYMLSNYSSSEPIYFGSRFKPFAKQGYMSGGAGYVLSKEALRRFIKGYSHNEHCRKKSLGVEDVLMGICLEFLNVTAVDSRDDRERGRFFPFPPDDHIRGLKWASKSFWFFQYAYYAVKFGLECCSDSAVSFHYIRGGLMHWYDYILYHVHPYGNDISFIRDFNRGPLISNLSVKDSPILTETTETVFLDEKHKPTRRKNKTKIIQ